MRTIFTRARLIGIGLVLGFVGVLYAQEPQIFQRGITVIRGEIVSAGIAGNTVMFEGATADASETRILVEDPTADRAWTIPNFGATNTFAGGAEVSEIVTAANVITAAESGSTFYLNASAGFLSTLPAPALGLRYRFFVHTVTSTNGYTIGTPTANIIDGMIVGRDGAAGVACQNEDLLTLVNGQSVTGDWVELRSDATNWYVYGMMDIAAGFTCGAT